MLLFFEIPNLSKFPAWLNISLIKQITTWVDTYQEIRQVIWYKIMQNASTYTWHVQSLCTNYTYKIFVGIPVAATKVAFGYGGSSSTLKSYGAHKGINKIPGLSSDGKCILCNYIFVALFKISTACVTIFSRIQVALNKYRRKNIRNHG